jgi:hypothetical protein
MTEMERRIEQLEQSAAERALVAIFQPSPKPGSATHDWQTNCASSRRSSER